jgi:hypothetical protein
LSLAIQRGRKTGFDSWPSSIEVLLMHAHIRFVTKLEQRDAELELKRWILTAVMLVRDEGGSQQGWGLQSAVPMWQWAERGTQEERRTGIGTDTDAQQ